MGWLTSPIVGGLMRIAHTIPRTGDRGAVDELNIMLLVILFHDSRTQALKEIKILAHLKVMEYFGPS